MALISGFSHKIVEVHYKNIEEYVTYYLDKCEIDASYSHFGEYTWYIDEACTIPVSNFLTWQSLYDAGAMVEFEEEHFFGVIFYGKEEEKPKKFLDINGVSFLFNQLSLQDYPNNETLIAVIQAIDENKADRKDIKQSDWLQEDNSSLDYIKNKPVKITNEEIDTICGFDMNKMSLDQAMIDNLVLM